jgi:hypothetical protein
MSDQEQMAVIPDAVPAQPDLAAAQPDLAAAKTQLSEDKAKTDMQAKTLYMFSDMEGCQISNSDKEENSTAMCDPKFYNKLYEMMGEEKNKNMHVAFLGDYFDQGLRVIPSLQGMSRLYNKYGPDRVFIILGNRDINKLRFMYELTHEVKSEPLYNGKIPTDEPEEFVDFKNGWNSAWNPYYHGLHYKRVTAPGKLDKTKMPTFTPDKNEVDLVKLILQTSMGASNRLPNDASKFVGLYSFIPPDYQKDKSDEDALAYLKASFGMGLPQSGGDSRSISIAYDKQRKEKEKQKLETRKNLEEQQKLEARKKLEEQQRLEAQQKLSAEIQEFKFDILAFYKKCKIAHVFDLGNGENVLLAHGGGFNKGCFFNKAYIESFGQGNGGNVTPENYLQMMETFRRKLSQPEHGMMAETVQESVDVYNQLLLDVVTELTSIEGDAKYTWKFVLLQALGLKPDVDSNKQDKIYNSLVQSCSQNGCTGQSSYVKQANGEAPDEVSLYNYLKASGITHVSYGHKPVCFPIPLMYSRANMQGIMFISNDTSNGNRRTSDLGSTIVVGTKIDFSSTLSEASICYIPIPGEPSSAKDETDFNTRFKSFLDLKLKKDDAPQYTPNGDIFQLTYKNGLTVSMNMNKPPPDGFKKLDFTPPTQGGRRSRRRRYTKKIKQRSKRRVQKKRAATRAKRERKTRK